MSQDKPRQISLPPRRIFGTGEVAASGDEQPLAGGGAQQTVRRPSGRVSFSTVKRPSFASRSTVQDEEAGLVIPPTPERPPIPNALQPGEAYSTPLPILSMFVLSIVCIASYEPQIIRLNVTCRRCLANSCLRMYQRLSYCSWFKDLTSFTTMPK